MPDAKSIGSLPPAATGDRIKIIFDVLRSVEKKIEATGFSNAEIKWLSDCILARLPKENQ